MKTNCSTVSSKALCLVLIFPAVLFCVSCQSPRGKTADVERGSIALHASSIFPASGMLDPWGNPYVVCLPGNEPVLRSADPIYVDPWGNPYKIVPR
jgi:hypothetical protein